MHLPCRLQRQRFPSAAVCSRTLMSTQHLHCSPFIPGVLQTPAVPAGWAAVGPHPAGREQEVHAGFPPVKEPPALGGAFWTGPFSGSLLGWQGVSRWEPTMSFLLFNYSFLFPFSATGRRTSSPSPSRHFYDFREVGKGEGSSDRTPGRSHTTWAVSPGFISPVAARMSLSRCLTTRSGLMFSPLAQGLSLCNSLFASNLVKERQRASELGLNGAQGFESLAGSWLQL